VSANGLVRLNQNGSIDNTFDYGTGLAYSGNSFNTGIILNNGVHIVFGEFSQYNGVNVNDIAFLSPFGTLLNCPDPTPTPTTTPTYTPTPTST
jgi:phage tail protein X